MDNTNTAFSSDEGTDSLTKEINREYINDRWDG
jgi:hypothetical protein